MNSSQNCTRCESKICCKSVTIKVFCFWDHSKLLNSKQAQPFLSKDFKQCANGRESRSCGYGRRLMITRLVVRIQVVKILLFFKKTRNKWKSGCLWTIFKKQKKVMCKTHWSLVILWVHFKSLPIQVCPLLLTVR